MNDILGRNDIVELLYRYDNERGVPADARATMRAAAHEIKRLSKATGGLSPALVAKALIAAQGEAEFLTNFADYFTDDERAALDAATFEVPE